LGVLGVGDSVTDDLFEEGPKNTTCLIVNCGRYTLDSTTASKTVNRGLCDPFNIVAGVFEVTSGTRFSETFATFPMSLVDKPCRYSLLAIMAFDVQLARLSYWSMNHQYDS
jgi:hypothetical protein